MGTHLREAVKEPTAGPGTGSTFDGEGEPGGEGGQLLVLPPRRAEAASLFGHPAL
jgi:hypothetical protein